MTKDDLREIRAFGWMQQILLASGTFFFSGAFWLLAELIAHQQMEEKKFEFTAYMGMCLLSMAFGIILAGLALALYVLKEKRLKKYPTTPATAS